MILYLGRFYWFMRDDWVFITERELNAGDLLADHNGHWSTVPVVAFRILYALFGLRTYLPYQMVVVALHVGVIALSWVIMRRAEVGPWLATAAAAALLLFGTGRQGIVWAFQVGLTGAIFWGLLQLVLADHDGPPSRVDGVALLAGALAISSAGTGVPMVIATGLTLLLRRGWKRAALHTVPLAALYLLWSSITHPRESSPYGRPDLDTALDWMWSAGEGTFEGLGQHPVVSWTLVATLVVGLVALGASRERRTYVVATAAPLSLLVAGLVFAALTMQLRWILGPDAAQASRYVYVTAVLTMPALAVAVQQLARHVRVVGPLFAALILSAVPANVAAFDDPPFARPYHSYSRTMVTSAVRVPYVREVARDASPLPGPFNSNNLDMGFLLQAERAGKLEPSQGAMRPEVANELAVRLNLSQRAAGDAMGLLGVRDLDALLDRCTPVAAKQNLRPARGTMYLWDGAGGPVRLRPVSDGGPATGPTVTLDPRYGSLLVSHSEGWEFDWEPAEGQLFDLCELR